MNTESQLWSTLEKTIKRNRLSWRAQMTRIEATTHTGVSDVEYIMKGWHGWIELKVSQTRRIDTPLRFNSPYTREQADWLLAHHDPSHFLRSWLLIGLSGEAHWRGFILLPAPSTMTFLRTVNPTLEELLQRGFVVYDHPTLVLHQLALKVG